jgi:hypothetical protein
MALPSGRPARPPWASFVILRACHLLKTKFVDDVR